MNRSEFNSIKKSLEPYRDGLFLECTVSSVKAIYVHEGQEKVFVGLKADDYGKTYRSLCRFIGNIERNKKGKDLK